MQSHARGGWELGGRFFSEFSEHPKPPDVTITGETLEHIFTRVRNLHKAVQQLSGQVVSLERKVYELTRSDLGPGWSARAGLFIYFPKLPTELRCKVWAYALAVPRIIGIRMTDHTTRSIDPGYAAATTLRHELLEVNHEARVESLKTLEVLNSGCAEYTGSTKRIYFNPDLDTVWVSGLLMYLQSVMTYGGTTARLAIYDHQMIWEEQDNPCDHMSNLLWLGIRELTLVVSADVSHRGQAPSLSEPSRAPWSYQPSGFRPIVSTNWEEMNAKAMERIEERIEERELYREEKEGKEWASDRDNSARGLESLLGWREMTVKYGEITFEK